MKEIRDAYRRLLKRWHLDTCAEHPEMCNERVKEIIKTKVFGE